MGVGPVSLIKCCCGCGIYSNSLKGGSLPSGLSVSSGSWTWGSSGATTNSTNALVLCGVFPGSGSRYKGISASIAVSSVDSGDVIILYFNAGWTARITWGTSGSLSIYDASGNLMTTTPYSNGSGGDTFTLCLTQEINSGSSVSTTTDQGQHVSLTATSGYQVDSYCSPTTLQIGFGTGGTNTGGPVFANLAIQDRDYTDGSGNSATDPKSCGTCGCAASPAKSNAAAMQALTFTAVISGVVNAGNTCGDCAKLNRTFTCTYDPTSSSYSSLSFTSGDVSLGDDCISGNPWNTSFQVVVLRSGCLLQLQASMDINDDLYGLWLTPTTGSGIPYLFDASDLSAMNTLLATLAGSAGLTGPDCDSSGIVLEVTVA